MGANKIKMKWVKNISNFKLLDASGEPGDILADHRVDRKAMLLVRSGKLVYEEAGRPITLSAGEARDIPANVVHNVSCTTRAEFFVVMAIDALMRFET